MKTINYLHTAVILSALLVSAACTSEQSILGVKGLPGPVSASSNEEKRETPPMAELRDRLFNEVHVDEFGMLPASDHENFSRLCPRWSKQFAQLLLQLKITEIQLNEEDIKALFKIPNSLVVQKIASCSGEDAEKIKYDLMHHHWQYLSKQDEETRNKILLSLPRNLLIYGHARNCNLHSPRDNILYFIRKSIGLDPQKKLPFTPDDLWENEVFVRAIVQKSGYALQNASARLRNKKDIVLLAVQDLGHALQFASDRLKADKEIVSAAVTQCDTAIAFAKLDWGKDENWGIAIKALGHYRATEDIDKELWKKPAFARLVIEQCPNYADFFHLFSTTIRNDPEIKELQTKRDSTALKHTARLVLHLPFR